MAPPNISIAEGGGKRCKSPSSLPTSLYADQPDVGSNEAAVDGPGATDDFPSITSCGRVRRSGLSKP